MHIFWPVYEKLYKAVFGRLGKWALSYKKIEINCICCDLPGFFAGCQAHALLSCLRLLLCCPIQIHRNKRFPQKPKTDKNIFGVFSCIWRMADCQRVYSRVVWSLQRSPVHDACEPSRWDKLFQLLLLHYLLPGWLFWQLASFNGASIHAIYHFQTQKLWQGHFMPVERCAVPCFWQPWTWRPNTAVSATVYRKENWNPTFHS